jgi:hypothetical protein
MSFSESVKDAAFKKSGGQCECGRKTHGHTGRCANRVGRHTAEYFAQILPADGGSDELDNCLVLCKSCYAKICSKIPVQNSR